MGTCVQDRVHVEVQIVELGNIVTLNQLGDEGPSLRDKAEELRNSWKLVMDRNIGGFGSTYPLCRSAEEITTSDNKCADYWTTWRGHDFVVHTNYASKAKKEHITRPNRSGQV